MFALIYWITAKCNLNCKYCYESEKENCEITEEMIADSLHFLREIITERNVKELYIGFHGGEPMLKYKLLKYTIEKVNALSREMDCRVEYRMTTNALLFNEESIQYICDNVTDLSLSIDGMEETNKKNRVDYNGRDHYKTLIKNVKRVLERRSNARLRMTVTSETVPQLFENIKFLANMGAKNIVPSINLYDKNWDMSKFLILEEEMKKVAKYLFDHPDKENMTIGMIIDEKTVLKSLGDCNGGENKAILYPDGNLYPCLQLTPNKELIIGNIYSGFNRNKLEEIQCLSKRKIDLCDGCSNYPFCINMRCKLINKSFTGDYYTPPAVACNLENVIYRTMKYYYSLK